MQNILYSSSDPEFSKESREVLRPSFTEVAKGQASSNNISWLKLYECGFLKF